MVVSRRKCYLDIVKIIAIYLVLFNHTGERGFHLFTCRLDSNWYPLYLCASVVTKIAVPLFFMASGAVLLDKEETIAQVLKRRFTKYFVALALFSGIVYIYDFAEGRIENASMLSFCEALYSNKISNHFWYMYVYLAYILMLPIIRKAAKSLSDNDYKWMIAMYFVMQIIPMVEFILFKGNLTITNHFRFFITTNYLWYPLMGYYIDKKDDNCSNSRLLAMICLSVIAIIFTCFATQYRCSVTDNWSGSYTEHFFNNLIFIPAGTLFYCLKRVTQKRVFTVEAERVLTILAGVTFGIYMLEPIYRNVTDAIYYFLEPRIGSFLACGIWILFACICGGIATYVLKHIPGIKKLI